MQPVPATASLNQYVQLFTFAWEKSLHTEKVSAPKFTQINTLNGTSCADGGCAAIAESEGPLPSVMQIISTG